MGLGVPKMPENSKNMGLGKNKRWAPIPLHRGLERLLEGLTLRERSVLRLFHLRGASQRELAGALGMSRAGIRRLLRRAERRAASGNQAALFREWGHLTDEEQRLAYLHRVLGLSLREIARRGLVVMECRGDVRPPSASTLRRRMRAIERKVVRAEARRRSRAVRDEVRRFQTSSSSSG